MTSPIDIFLEEASELLEDIEHCGLNLESGDSNPDHINRLFRSFHTIKGSGAMFGFEQITEFTHKIEDALDLARSGKIPADPKLAQIVLLAKDHVSNLMDEVSGGATAPEENEKKILRLIENVKINRSEEITSPASSDSQPTTSDISEISEKEELSSAEPFQLISLSEKGHFSISGQATGQAASQLKEFFLKSIKSENLNLDLQGVQAIDLAAWQVLLAAKKHALQCNVNLLLSGLPIVLSKEAELLGMNSLLTKS